MAISHFRDFSEEERSLEGDKKKIDEILNVEITITGYRIGNSKYKDKNYLTLQYKKDEKEFITFTGSEVLQKQIEKYKGHIPFLVIIKKINNYYTLT